MKANGITHANDRAIEISTRRHAERAARADRDEGSDPVDRWTQHAEKLTAGANEGVRIEFLPRPEPVLTPVTSRFVPLPPTQEPEPTGEAALGARTHAEGAAGAVPPAADETASAGAAADTTGDGTDSTTTATEAAPTAAEAEAARYARTEPFARTLLDRVDGRIDEIAGSPLFTEERVAQVEALREDLANTLANLDPSNRGEMRQAARQAMHAFRAGVNATLLDAHQDRVDARIDRFLAQHEVNDGTRTAVEAIRAQYQQDLAALREDVLAPEGLSRHEMRTEFKALSERLMHAVREAVLHPQEVETQPTPTPVDAEPPVVEDSSAPTDPGPTDGTTTGGTDTTTGPTDPADPADTTTDGTAATGTTPATIAALGAELSASLQSITALVHDALDRLVALSPTSLDLSFSLSIGPSGANASFAAAYKGAGSAATPAISQKA